MPKNYTSSHLEIISMLADTLGKSTVLQAHQGDPDRGVGKLQRLNSNFNLLHEDVNKARTLSSNTGSGLKIGTMDFVTSNTGYLSDGMDQCHDAVTEILQDQNLMRREPMLASWLRFADVMFKRANLPSDAAREHFSDPATGLAQNLFSALENVPTAEEMAQLRLQDEEAYETGVKMMNFLNAYADAYEPDPEISAADLGKADPEARKQERIQKLKKLEDAASALNDLGEERVNNFFEATGNLLFRQNFVNTAFKDTNHSLYKTAEILHQKQQAMAEGMTEEEYNALLSFQSIVRTATEDLKGIECRIEDINEPFLSNVQAMTALADQCAYHRGNGFSSDQEKQEFFRSIASEIQSFEGNINRKDEFTYGHKSEEEKQRMRATERILNFLSPQCLPKDTSFHHMIRIHERMNGMEVAGKWNSQVMLAPYYAALKDTKTTYLGAKDSSLYQHYNGMMDALKNVTKLGQVKKPNELQKQALGENWRLMGEQSEAFLRDVLDNPKKLQAIQNDRKQTDLYQERVVGALGVLRLQNPGKAEQLKAKASALFGREISWDEVKTHAQDSMDRKPNYDRYFKMHTGDYAEGIPEKKVAEYAAKATAAMFYMNDPNKKFSLSLVRDAAQKLMARPDFKAAIGVKGLTEVRRILRSGDPVQIAGLVAGGPERYALSDNSRENLRSLAEGLNTDGRSKEYKALVESLKNENAKDSAPVFSAVEAYLKGKKAVTNNAQRKASVKLALDALSVAAANGDATAKRRAQNLVNRINKVRGAEPGDPNYVNLDNYGKKKEAARPLLPEDEAGPQMQA